MASRKVLFKNIYFNILLHFGGQKHFFLSSLEAVKVCCQDKCSPRLMLHIYHIPYSYIMEYDVLL